MRPFKKLIVWGVLATLTVTGFGCGDENIFIEHEPSSPVPVKTSAPAPQEPVTPPPAQYYCRYFVDAASNLTVNCDDGSYLYVPSWEQPQIYFCNGWYEVLYYRRFFPNGIMPYRLRVGYNWRLLSYRYNGFISCLF